MIGNKKVVVVMPAYNAAPTLEKTYRELPFNIVDEVISSGETPEQRINIVRYELIKLM